MRHGARACVGAASCAMVAEIAPIVSDGDDAEVGMSAKKCGVHNGVQEIVDDAEPFTLMDSPPCVSPGTRRRIVGQRSRLMVQVRAIIRRMYKIQLQKKRTNIGLIGFPMLLLVFLLLLQNVVDQYISSTVVPTLDPPLIPYTLGVQVNTDCIVTVPPDLTWHYVLESDSRFDTSLLGTFDPFANTSADLGSGSGTLLGSMSLDGSYALAGYVVEPGARGFGRSRCQEHRVLTSDGLGPIEIAGAPNTTDDAFNGGTIDINIMSHVSQNAFDNFLYDTHEEIPSAAAGAVYRTLDVDEASDGGAPTSGLLIDATLYYNGSISNSLDVGRLWPRFMAWAVGQLGNVHIIPEGFRLFPAESVELLDIVSIFGPFMFIIVWSLLIPIQVVFLTTERVSGMRLFMEVNGVWPSALWIGFYIFTASFFLLTMVPFYVGCVAFGFRVVTAISPGIVIITMLLWSLIVAAEAMVLATSFKTPSLASTVSYLIIFLTPLIAPTIVQVPVLDISGNATQLNLIALMPRLALYRIFFTWGANVDAGSTGLTFAEVSDDRVRIHEAWGMMILDWFILIALAAYMDRVLTDHDGSKGEHPLFFLRAVRRVLQRLRPGRARTDTGATQNHTLTAMGSVLGTATEMAVLVGSNADVPISEGASLQLVSLGYHITPRVFHDLVSCWPAVVSVFNRRSLHVDARADLSHAAQVALERCANVVVCAIRAYVAREPGIGGQLTASEGGGTDSGQPDPQVSARRRDIVAANTMLVDEKDAIVMKAAAEYGAGVTVSGASRFFELEGIDRPICAFHDVSFHVEPGECLCIIGPNASGKSVLLDTIAGRYRPSRGQIVVNGFTTSFDVLRVRQSVGLCPQFTKLWEGLTGPETLRFYGVMREPFSEPDFSHAE